MNIKDLKKLEKLINKIQNEEDSYIKEFCNENNINNIMNLDLDEY